MAELAAFMGAMRDEQGWDMLIDLTAVDWHEATPRYTGIYHLYATERKAYLRVACDCLDDDQPALPSLVNLWPAANWHEREAFDMFGIVFTGHPNLKRILMWEDYPHHPLRKDFPLAGIKTPLPAADVAEATGAQVEAAPMAGGPFRASSGATMSKSEPRGSDESWSEQHPKPAAESEER